MLMITGCMSVNGPDRVAPTEAAANPSQGNDGQRKNTPCPVPVSVTPEQPGVTEQPQITGTPQVTGQPQVTGAPQITGAPQVTGQPQVTGTPQITGQPQVTGTPQPDSHPKVASSYGMPAIATPVPTLPAYKTTTRPQVAGRVGRMNEGDYFRPNGYGRTAKKEFLLKYDSKIVIVDSVVSKYNETWYYIAILLDGTVRYGYVQASSVEIGMNPQPTPKGDHLVTVTPAGNELTLHYGEDRDGDGTYVVVLDPGHGGVYSGAHHYGTDEKEINLMVAKECRKYLLEHYDNVAVYLTRCDDTVYDNQSSYDDLEWRVQYAETMHADVLLSLHFNAAAGSASGTEVLVPRKQTVAEQDRIFGCYLLEEMAKEGPNTLGLKSKWSERSRYRYPGTEADRMDGYLINRLSAERGIVSCIIEHVYMDARDDRKYWDNDAKVRSFGRADARAIAKYLDLPRKQAEKEQ